MCDHVSIPALALFFCNWFIRALAEFRRALYTHNHAMSSLFLPTNSALFFSVSIVIARHDKSSLNIRTHMYMLSAPNPFIDLCLSHTGRYSLVFMSYLRHTLIRPFCTTPTVCLISACTFSDLVLGGDLVTYKSSVSVN